MSGALFIGIVIAGLVLLFNGAVQLAARNITDPWKYGGASLLVGAIIAVVSAFKVWLTGRWLVYQGTWWWLFIAGLVLTFNGAVQLCVRKKTGPWKEGGATSLAGAIIAGVSVLEVWLAGTMFWWGFLIAGLVLAFNGVVQLCIRKKTGPWKEGGASLLAGAIIAGVSVFLACLAGIKELSSVTLFMGFIIAGLVLAFNGVVQLCVRKKTGQWKEGGATLLAGAIILGVCFVLLIVGLLLSPM
jgi:hypothetical protein